MTRDMGSSQLLVAFTWPSLLTNVFIQSYVRSKIQEDRLRLRSASWIGLFGSCLATIDGCSFAAGGHRCTEYAGWQEGGEGGNHLNPPDVNDACVGGWLSTTISWVSTTIDPVCLTIKTVWDSFGAPKVPVATTWYIGHGICLLWGQPFLYGQP